MRMDDGRVVPNFFAQALRGEPLTVYGDGKQTRSFCFVDDLVEGIYRLLLSDFHFPVNLGNPDEITILEFAEEVKQMVDNNVEIKFHPLPVDDPMKRQPDIRRAKEILGWAPQIPRAEGMPPTLDFFKKRLHG